jgi:hypothetical protein
MPVGPMCWEYMFKLCDVAVVSMVEDEVEVESRPWAKQ